MLGWWLDILVPCWGNVRMFCYLVGVMPWHFGTMPLQNPCILLEFITAWDEGHHHQSHAVTNPIDLTCGPYLHSISCHYKPHVFPMAFITAWDEGRQHQSHAITNPIDLTCGAYLHGISSHVFPMEMITAWFHNWKGLRQPQLACLAHYN